MINCYNFTDKNLKGGFKSSLEIHNINHANSILTMTPNFPEFGTELRYFNKIIEEVSVVHARLINPKKYKLHTLFSLSFCKTNEDQRNNEIDFIANLNINNN